MLFEILICSGLCLLGSNFNYCTADQPEIDPQIRDRFLADAPSRWKRYVLEVGGKSVVFDMHSITTIKTLNRDIEREMLSRSRYHGTLNSQYETPLREPGDDQSFDELTKEKAKIVRLKNSDYEVVANRTNRTWVTTDLKRREGQEDWKNQDVFCRSAMLLFAVPVWELVESDTFSITSASQLPNGHVKIGFENRVDSEELEIKKGEIVFDPDNYWTIQSAHYWIGKTFSEVGDDNRTEISNKFENSLEGIDRVISDWECRQYDSGTLAREYKVHFSNLHLSSEQLKEKDCRLPAIGLPEPEWARQQSMPWFLIGSIVACVLIVVGFVVVRRLRRQADHY